MNMGRNDIVVADSNAQLNNKQKRVRFSDVNTYAKTRLVANKKTRDALDIVLAEKFANGFRFTSKIEIGRLRKFAGDLLG